MSLVRGSTLAAVAERSPGVDTAIRARNAVERASAAIPQIALVLDREGIGERLRRAVECAYVVIDSDVLAPAHYDGLSEGAVVVREAMALLLRGGDRASDPSLAAAAAALEAAATDFTAGAEAVAQIQLAQRFDRRGGAAGASLPAPRPFRASTGVPALHAFPRRPLITAPSLEAVVPLPSPEAPHPTIPRPSTLGDLTAFATAASSGELEKSFTAAAETAALEEAALPPFTYEYEPAIEEVEMVRRLARDCLEDIAIHRDLRKQNELETWLDQGPFEQRLLDNLDAFASFGGAALPLVSLFHAEAKAADAGRGFAVALTLGSIEGSDTVFAAVATLKQSAPESFPGWIEGFSLGSSPMIDAAMADLCTSDRPELVALALDVLHARRATPDDVVARLLDRPEPEIARRVARALGTSLPDHTALQQLDRVATTTGDDELFLASVESMCLRGEGSAVALLRRAADASAAPARARLALSLLCLVGRAADLERLLAGVRADPTIDLVRGLGRFGHVEALPTLIACLGDEKKELVAAAAEALERITGAGLRQIVEEPWDIELPPEAADAGGLPVPTRKVERVVTDPAQWTAWVNDEARTLDARLKTRGGVAFTPLQIVAELEARSTPPDRRVEAALELALVTGTPSLFSPHDWVGRQKKHLAELQARVATTGFTPGSWAVSSAMHEREIVSAPAADPVETLAPPLELSPHEGALATTGPMAPIFPRNPLPFQPAPATPPLASQAPTALRASELSWPGREEERGAGRVTPSYPIIDPAKPVLPFKSTLADRVWDPASSSGAGHAPPFVAPREGARQVPIAPPSPVSVVASVERANPTEPRLGGATASQLSPEARNRVNGISLAQYSELCAMIAAFPDRVVEIHAQYGLDQHACNALNALWEERFERDPHVRQRWEFLVAGARARQGR